ncbi:hypothetical protein DMH15_02660 [Streptomyces sp. WAC 06725]|nr:hypothetical protein DMH15_02660 [Streptomyces sp. WAC 06725]
MGRRHGPAAGRTAPGHRGRSGTPERPTEGHRLLPGLRRARPAHRVLDGHRGGSQSAGQGRRRDVRAPGPLSGAHRVGRPDGGQEHRPGGARQAAGVLCLSDTRLAAAPRRTARGVL